MIPTYLNTVPVCHASQRPFFTPTQPLRYRLRRSVRGTGDCPATVCCRPTSGMLTQPPDMRIDPSGVSDAPPRVRHSPGMRGTFPVVLGCVSHVPARLRPHLSQCESCRLGITHVQRFLAPDQLLMRHTTPESQIKTNIEVSARDSREIHTELT